LDIFLYIHAVRLIKTDIRMVKKSILLVLVMFAGISFTACSNDDAFAVDEASPAVSSTRAAVDASETAAASESEGYPKIMEVCVVYTSTEDRVDLHAVCTDPQAEFVWEMQSHSAGVSFVAFPYPDDADFMFCLGSYQSVLFDDYEASSGVHEHHIFSVYAYNEYGVGFEYKFEVSKDWFGNWTVSPCLCY